MGQRKSQILTFGRKLHDVGRVVAESVCDAGGTDEDIERVFGDSLRRKVGLLVMGRLPLALKPSEIHAADLIPKDYEVVDDVEPTVTDIAKFRPRRILKDGESYVGGDEMRKRAVEAKGNLGLSDGKRIIAEQNKFSAEFEGFYIPLPGTVLRDPGGDPCLAYLDRGGGRWCLDFVGLDVGWDGSGRFACSE